MIPNNATKWVKTPFTNLYKSPAGTYWMKAKIQGRLIRKSLKTRSFEIAQKKLRQTHDHETKQLSVKTEATFAVISDEWLAIDAQSREIKDTTKRLHKATVSFLLRTWPELGMLNVAKIKDCDEWAARVRVKYSATRYNSAVMTMRSIFKLAIKRDLIFANPTANLEFATRRQKVASIPTSAQFQAMLTWLERRPKTRPTAILVRVLAYTGMRAGEAKQLQPSMVDFAKAEIRLPGTATKNSEARSIPIIAELKPILKKLLKEYTSPPLLPVFDIRAGLTAVCAEVGVARMTHHDLRKLFATRCIESGVDIRTVAQWLGHRDGGALLLKTYAHLRNEHSQNMARLVKFS